MIITRARNFLRFNLTCFRSILYYFIPGYTFLIQVPFQNIIFYLIKEGAGFGIISTLKTNIVKRAENKKNKIGS